MLFFSRHDNSVNESRRTYPKWITKNFPELAYFVVFALLITLLFPRGNTLQFSDLKEGSVYVGQEIIAPFNFPVLKSAAEYEEDVKKTRDSVAPVFIRVDSITNAQLTRYRSFAREISNHNTNNSARLEKIATVLRQNNILLPTEDVQFLFVEVESNTKVSPKGQAAGETSDDVLMRSLINRIEALLEDFYAIGILDVQKTSLPAALSKISVIQSNNQEILEDLQYYHDLEGAQKAFLARLRNVASNNDREVKIAYQIGTSFLAPNVIFNKSETDLRIEDSISHVALAKDQVLAGERIIDSHQKITRQHIEKLMSLDIARSEQRDAFGFWAQLAPWIGKYLLTLSIISLLFIYLSRDRQGILKDWKKLSLFGLGIYIIMLLCAVVNQLSYSALLVPVAMVAIIIAIFFDFYIALIVSLVISFLLGAMRSNEFGIVYISLLGSVAAAWSVCRVRTRKWIVPSMLAITGAYIVGVTVYDLVTTFSWNTWVTHLGYSVGNGLLSPILASGFVILIESVFRFTTKMTLLELSDLNQPLLRQLALHAPGSYHHSLMVGTLAEAAAEAIGADSILARVGSYYHDIGKMEKPEYFVENQTKGRNPQEKLNPTMSSLILANHVRRGAEIARLYKLPREVEAFIFQHHGTGLMSYFYQKALEQNPAESVSENKFRYPGPRPQTKETAIVMLADAIEAASRTLKDPPPSRIKGLVDQIIDERFRSGELSEAPLTLRDLTKISEAFYKVLNAVFHGRIEYPTIQEKRRKVEKKPATSD